MTKNFSSEELKRDAIELFNDSGDTNYNRVFEALTPSFESLFSDDVSVDDKKEILNKSLKLYSQMIVMESVNLTLNSLVKAGTLGEDFMD